MHAHKAKTMKIRVFLEACLCCLFWELDGKANAYSPLDCRGHPLKKLVKMDMVGHKMQNVNQRFESKFHMKQVFLSGFGRVRL